MAWRGFLRRDRFERAKHPPKMLHGALEVRVAVLERERIFALTGIECTEHQSSGQLLEFFDRHHPMQSCN
jgi:hypothetical protein